MVSTFASGQSRWTPPVRSIENRGYVRAYLLSGLTVVHLLCVLALELKLCSLSALLPGPCSIPIHVVRYGHRPDGPVSSIYLALPRRADCSMASLGRMAHQSRPTLAPILLRCAAPALKGDSSGQLSNAGRSLAGCRHRTSEMRRSLRHSGLLPDGARVDAVLLTLLVAGRVLVRITAELCKVSHGCFGC